MATMIKTVEISPVVREIGEIAAVYGRKFEVEDMIEPTLRRSAVDFLKGYAGSFSFLLDVRAKARQAGKLTPGQAKGVLNCAAAEYRWLTAKAQGADRSEAVSAPVSGPVAATVPDGYYTVVMPNGERRTIRLDSADWAKGQPAGTQAAYFLNGPDNTSDYVFFAFVWGARFQVTRKFEGATILRDALAALLSLDKIGYVKAGEAYAVESSRCARCNRMLTVVSSVSLGYGPVCAEKLGLA